MVIAVTVLPIAAGAFVLAGASIVGATLLPKRTQRRMKPASDVKIVFMETAVPPADPKPSVGKDDDRNSEVQRAVVDAPEPEAQMVHRFETVDRTIEAAESSPAVDTMQTPQPVVGGEEGAMAPRSGLGSFLRFGMGRKRNPAAESMAAANEEESPQDQLRTEGVRPRRKLFSRKAAVVKHVDASDTTDRQPAAAVPGDDVVAAVETAAGTTTVDARGVIREEPAEAEFPIERFAQNDRVQDVVYASERERMEAEHRMEMERLASEREAFDAQHRQAQEAKEAKHRRAIDILETRARLRAEAVQAQADARATIEARLAKWWVRLDPEVDAPEESDRLRLAGSLEAIRAPWAGKLICTALEQDESERVRARLLGAYARGYRSEAAPFEKAVNRSILERYAVIEALTPFIEEAPWIAEIVARASGEAGVVGPAAPPEVSSEASVADVERSEASVIQLPAPESPPALPHDAVVAAAS